MSETPEYLQWVEYAPGEDLSQYGLPVVGDRVEISDSYPGLEAEGLPEGTRGTVVKHGRGKRADLLFRANEARAKAAERELTAEDYEPLIDSEGPVVRFDNGTEHWFPGQSGGAIRLIKDSGPAINPRGTGHKATDERG